MTTTEKIELFKWFLGSVVLVLIPIIINWGIDDRRQGLDEVKQYDKFATELILTNNSLGKRRLVAQYFSYVIPSEKLRKPWERYYKLLDMQYKALQKKDSLLLERISGVGSTEERFLEEEAAAGSNNTESSKIVIDPDMERMLKEHEQNLKDLDDKIDLPKR